MGVDKEGVVVHLAGVTPACWVGVLLTRLKTAMATQFNSIQAIYNLNIAEMHSSQ